MDKNLKMKIYDREKRVILAFKKKTTPEETVARLLLKLLEENKK